MIDVGRWNARVVAAVTAACAAADVGTGRILPVLGRRRSTGWGGEGSSMVELYQEWIADLSSSWHSGPQNVLMANSSFDWRSLVVLPPQRLGFHSLKLPFRPVEVQPGTTVVARVEEVREV